MTVFKILISTIILIALLLFFYHLYKETMVNYGRFEGDKFAIFVSLSMMALTALVLCICAALMMKGQDTLNAREQYRKQKR